MKHHDQTAPNADAPATPAAPAIPRDQVVLGINPPYIGEKMLVDELLMPGTDGSQWPTDDLFALYRECDNSIRIAGPDGRSDHGTVGPADDETLKVVQGLADSGGTRGVGNAYNFQGNGSEKVRSVIAQWKGYEQTVHDLKHPDQAGQQVPRHKKKQS